MWRAGRKAGTQPRYDFGDRGVPKLQRRNQNRFFAKRGF
jgi:hypothetical protein